MSYKTYTTTIMFTPIHTNGEKKLFYSFLINVTSVLPLSCPANRKICILYFVNDCIVDTLEQHRKNTTIRKQLPKHYSQFRIWKVFRLFCGNFLNANIPNLIKIIFVIITTFFFKKYMHKSTTITIAIYNNIVRSKNPFHYLKSR